jgi:trigger factor
MSDVNERLTSSVKDLSAARKEIEAELRAEDVGREYDRILEQYIGRAKLKGFREGHAPKEVVKQMFGPDIQKSVLDELIPKVLEEVLEGRGIHPVGIPVVEDIAYDEGTSLRFKAVVEVWPDFELPVYTKIRAKKPSITVSEADVTRALDELREKAAEFLPVEDRGVVRGDFVAVELQGKDLKIRRLMPVEKVTVLAGHEGNDPAVNSNLLSLKPGEDKTFRHAYPADHKNKKLAGREIEYRLKVISIKDKRLPETNDDFARTLGEFDSLAALQDKIRQEIQASREQAGRRETAEEILRTVVDRASIELPPSIVDEETEAVLKSMLQAVPASAVTQELLDTLRGAARKQAESNLKRHLLLRKIAAAESIKITEEDVDQEIAGLAERNGLPAARAMESFAQGERRAELKNSLLVRKTIDFLVGQAIIE